MKSAFTISLGLALALVAAPASAQTGSLSKREREALQALVTAVQARNYSAATSALATAQAAAQSAYARYLASSLQLRLGAETNNSGLQMTALDSMIGSGVAPAAELPNLYKNKGALAQQIGKYDEAEQAYGRWAELAPNDSEALIALAEVRNLRKKIPESAAALDRAIDLRKAAGQPVPESWYKRGFKQAFDGRLPEATLEFSQGLVAAYPTRENWRDALLAYRDLVPLDAAAKIDLWRLMHSANALAGERDYVAFAQALSEAGYAAEAKAVLDKGVAAKMVDPAKADAKALIAATGKKAAANRAALKGLESKAASAKTGEAALTAGDALLAAGEHSKAADQYRAALEKGSVDTALVQNRLGMALALAGQKAEAETALRAVTGPRAGLANYWLLWLAQRSPSA
jgi:tetratricopeptide (TPR) repeat protein